MKNKFYRPILYYLLIGCRALFSLLPLKMAVNLGGNLGRSAFRMLPKERRRTMEHLSMAFGKEKSQSELMALGERVFENYGRTAAELALLDKLIPRFDQWVSMQGKEYLTQGLAGGKGVIIVTAHFGNWEIMGGYNAIRGIPLTVIARKIYYEKYDKLIVQLRKKMNVEIIYRDGSVKAMLQTLRKNRILAFVVDQDVSSIDGVFVDFFGKPAYSSTAPVRFAMTTGAPIVPAFCVRESATHHRIVVLPPMELEPREDKEEMVRVNTQKWAKIQEDFIRQYPHLWVWNHRRWKTQPIKK